MIARIVETTNARKTIPAAARGLWKTQSQSMPARSGSAPASRGAHRWTAPTPASSKPSAESKIVSTSRLEASVGYDEPFDSGAARCRAAAGLPRARAAVRSPRCPPRTRRRCRASGPWTRGRQRRRCSATRDSATAIRPRWQRIASAERQELDRGELVEERLDCVDEPGHRHILAATALRSAPRGDRQRNLADRPRRRRASPSSASPSVGSSTGPGSSSRATVGSPPRGTCSSCRSRAPRT